MIMEKYNALQNILREMETIVVAFSGGVDSTFLLKAALDTLGPERVLAVTTNSESFPAAELEEAKKIAIQLGAKHCVIETSEIAIPGYKENDINRCYYCKKNLFQLLIPMMESHGYKNVVYGLIADDLREHRPGVKAAKELEVRGPLQEAGLYKEEIRLLSKEMNLPTWDKPSLACLSSRVAYGEVITSEKLTKIDQSEEFIRSLGIRQVRVRTHEETARIEVEPKDMSTVLKNYQAIQQKLVSFGYTYVTLDLSGYESGSMNKKL
ncbi:ATP-dependent sacrificial sulfur transferase LarE [Ammoniphilus sp. 3BR4]|uniref:ATP-dependent sacrificial sulfur transferase LarE n=1 Tax=Ammoniphilus sp. 3BR4 TaxID=3158265 RepID=UPI0034650C19